MIAPEWGVNADGSTKDNGVHEVGEAWPTAWTPFYWELAVGSGLGVRAGIAAALLWTAAQADAPSSVSALKQATLELLRAQPHAPEGAGTVTVYFGNRDPGVLIDELRVSVDGAAPQRYEYGNEAAAALHQGGLHRFTVLQLAPGAHHLRADFAARYADAPPDHWRSAGRVDQDFAVEAQPLFLELELVKGSYIGKPDLQFHVLKAAGEGPAAADSYAPGSGSDPHLRYAAFLNASGHPLAAAEALYATPAQSEDWQAQLAQTRAALGLAAPVDDAPLAANYETYNKGVALLTEGKLAEGAAVLEPVAGGKASDPESWALRDQANLVLGYAYLRNHAGAAAVPLFSRVRSPGPCSNAAMLGLGWALLAPSGNGEHVAQGSAPFQRIPVLLQPQLTPDIAQLKRHEPYRLKQAAKPEEDALRRALVPWTELIGRDPLDPAVQEGMIAIPYAMNHIGSYEEAQEYFQRAIALLEAVDAQLEAAQRRVAAGRLAQVLDTRGADSRGWDWWLALYPKEHWWLADNPREPLNAPDNFYLQHLMADYAFRAALDDFHDLGLLEDLARRLDGGAALLPRIDSAQSAQAAQLQALALGELKREQQHTRMYLGEARFALAHANELPPPEVKPTVKPGAKP